MNSSRLERLRAKIYEQQLDAFLVSTPENRNYISGFTGSAGYLLVSKDAAILATDFRYIEQAQAESPHFEVLKVGPWSWMPEQLDRIKATRVGIEGHHITMTTYNAITKAIHNSSLGHKPNLLSTMGLVESLRAVKEPEEIILLQKVIDISDQAMEIVTPTIKSGETEKQVAWRLEKTMRELGADSLSFDTIVAGGPNGAMPHHRASDRPIQIGEPIVIDMGAKLNGYCSDITRTICVGEPDDIFNKIYDLVLTSQLAAIATLKPNLTGDQGDNLARTILNDAGYSENFGHSLGHGIGLAVHEHPRVGPTSPDPLEEGMVFSVEPGLYLSGWGGVRIEDLVVMEHTGARPLSKAKK